MIGTVYVFQHIPSHPKLKVVIAILFLAVLQAIDYNYRWKEHVDRSQALSRRITPPSGYARTEVDERSFAAWLRGLPLKPGKPDVQLYNGKLKNRQDVHTAVVDIDVGKRDLQQCADAVMRLRAEYLYSRERYDSILFTFTNGFKFPYSEWAKGWRVSVEGRNVSWIRPADWDLAGRSDHESFMSYMTMVFSYCGTLSLEKDMQRVDLSQLKVGDVFIHGGSPGHAVLVLDVAVNPEGKKVFLLGQSYMPAQDFHVLKNPNNSRLSPWYEADFAGQLVTPEWAFEGGELRRF